jgi:hypothetical protein
MNNKLSVFKSIRSIKYTGIFIGLICMAFNPPLKKLQTGNLNKKLNTLKQTTTLKSGVSVTTLSDSAKVLFSHKSFKDFSKGTLSDFGSNLYVSQKGNIQFINLFDLNADGYPEAVINNDHNHYETPDLLIYHNRKPSGLRSLTNANSQDAPAFQNFKWMMESLGSITRLPAEGGGKAVVADLNKDGYKDLIFTNFIHGSTLQNLPAYIYWGGSDGLNPLRRSVVNADRASSVAVGDLNGDGLDDIVFANLGREHLSAETPEFSHTALEKKGGDREKTSYIYMQTESGFTESSVEKIPTLFALDVKIADLDHNGQPAIIFLETGEPGALRIYRKQNGKWKMSDLLPVIAPKSPFLGKKINREILVKDLNNDGFPDIFAPSNGKHSEIYWSDKGKFSTKNHTVLNSENAFSADAGDLNKDGFTDLVVANFSYLDKDGKPNFETNSYVWWGSKEGFIDEKRTALPTLGATSVRLADINNTGSLDVLFAQHRDNKTYDVPSYIYLNSGSGISPGNRTELQGFGTISIIADDLYGNGVKDVILINSISGKARYAGTDDGPGNEGVSEDGLPMYIYHGNPDKLYNTANQSRVPLSSPETNIAFADMEDNGKAALVHIRAGGYRLTIRYDIYNYPKSNELTEIAIPFRANSANVADFNKDGILDILVTPINGPQAILFFGQGNRKYKEQIFDFKHQAYTCAVGDLNNDGLLDAVTACHQEISILFGSNAGGQFHFLEPKIISTSMLTTRVSMADFNGDGWLDILTENLQDDITKSYDIESWVLVNNKGSFSTSNKHSFHTFGANGGTVAQLNGDGKLDVVLSNYHADISRRTGAFILKADKEGFPTDEGRVRLPAFSAGANIVLDFNGDGYQDIMVYNHTGADVYNGSLTPTGGMHGVGSAIYWGGKDGYSLANSSHMPSFGPHSRISADPGSASRRNPYETYTSEKITNTTGSENFNLTITGRFNAKQYVSPKIILISNSGKSEIVTPKPILNTADKASYLIKIPKGQTFKYELNLNSSNSGNGPLVSGVKMEAVVN